jgi:hypothetical protein
MAAPHFSWGEAAACPAIAVPDPSRSACNGYSIQIESHSGSVAAGVRTLTGKTAAIITRFVPVRGLSLGAHRWRVGTVPSTRDDNHAAADVMWSEWRAFTIVEPLATIHVAPNSSYAEMQSAFAAASNSTSVRVLFDPTLGKRSLSPPTSATVFATLVNCSDVVLDFSGATLTLERWVGFFAITDCARVVVRNLTLDVVPLPYTSMRVESIDKGGAAFVGSVLPGHPSPIANPNLINTRPGAEVQDPVTTWTKRGVTEVWEFFPNVTHLKLAQYKVWLQPEAVRTKAGQASAGLEVGDIFTMGQRVAAAGFRVIGGEEVVFLDVTAHGCANECFTSAFTSKLSILGGGLVLSAGWYHCS